MMADLGPPSRGPRSASFLATLMQDLLLWRLLLAPQLDPAPLTPLLRALAPRTVLDKLPFLGFLPPALAHSDPALRAAALSALGGATGRPSPLGPPLPPPSPP